MPSQAQSFNLKPSLWGPYTWMTLHFAASVYPIDHPSKDVQTAFINLLYRLQPLLPCDTCSQNYKGELRQFPPEKFVSCRAHIIRFTIELHNSVNKRLHKKVYTVKEAMCVFRQLEREPVNSLRYVWVCLLALMIPLAKREQEQQDGSYTMATDEQLQRFWGSFWTYCTHIPQLQPFVSIVTRAMQYVKKNKGLDPQQNLYTVIQEAYGFWKHRYMSNAQKPLISSVDQTIEEMRSGKGRCTIGRLLDSPSNSKTENGNEEEEVYQDARQVADTQEPVTTCDHTNSSSSSAQLTNNGSLASTPQSTDDDNSGEKLNSQHDDKINEDIAEELSPQDREDIVHYRSLSTAELRRLLRKKRKKVNNDHSWWTAFWGYLLLFVIMVGIVLTLRVLAHSVNVNKMTDRILPKGLNVPIRNEEDTKTESQEKQKQDTKQQR